MDFLSKNNFIETYQIRNDICDNLIEYYNRPEVEKAEGSTTFGVNKKSKDSMDARVRIDEIKDSPEIQEYVKNLLLCVRLYQEKYEYCHTSSFGITEDFNIQYYPPSGGYKKWHTERGSSKHPICNRHLVFMTYLNDVYSRGETEFYYQKKKFKSRKGKTLIWPADWTHTHRGIPSHKEEKYIITGWLSYFDSEDYNSIESMKNGQIMKEKSNETSV